MRSITFASRAWAVGVVSSMVVGCGSEHDFAELDPHDATHEAVSVPVLPPSTLGETLIPADAVVFQPTAAGNVQRGVDGSGLNFCFPDSTPAGGVAVAAGRAWVTDVCNERVLGFPANSQTGDSATIVLQQRDLFDTRHRHLAQEDDRPVAVATDSSGRVYVATASNGVFVYDNPTTSGEPHSFKLSEPPVNLTDLKIVLLGPSRDEYVATVGSTDVVFYPVGGSDPVEAFSLELIPCSFSLTGLAQIGDTLLLACRNTDNRCEGFAQGASPPSYSPPSYACSAVYAARINTAVNQTEYRFPRLDPLYGSDIVPVYTSPHRVRSVAASTALDTVWVADEGHRTLRYAGAINHIDGVFNQLPGNTNHPNEAVGQGSAATPVYGQANTTDVFPNRDPTLVGESVAANSLYYPGAITVDSLGDLWIADVANHRLLRFANAVGGSTSAAAVLGQGSPTVRLANRLDAKSAQAITDVAIRSDGRFFVTDALSHRVLSFASVLSLPPSPAADRVYGQVFFDTSRANNQSGGGALQANDLQAPTAAAVDPGNGDLYVSDSGNRRILVYSGTSTTPTTVIGAPNLTTTGNSCFVFKSMAVRNGTLYVAAASRANGVNVNCTDNPNANRVFAYNLPYTTAEPSKARPDRVFGQDVLADLENTPNLPNRGLVTPRADTFNDVSGLWVDANNRLWVADRGNHRVLWFDNPNGADLAEATTADGVVGQEGMHVANGGGPYTSPSAFGFTSPEDVVVDNTGGLWVSVPAEHRVLYFPTPELGAPDLPQASLVLGQRDFIGAVENDGGSCPAICDTSARGLSSPTALALDGSGRHLLVTDTGNNRLLRYTMNRAPSISGAGTFVVEPGETRAVPLTIVDPDGDSVDEPVVASVSPPSALAQLTLQGAQISYTAPAGSEGQQVRVRVDARDTANRPLTASASVVFIVVPPGTSDESSWAPQPQPAPTTPTAPDTGCLCSGADPSGWLLIAACTWILRRRRQRRGA